MTASDSCDKGDSSGGSRSLTIATKMSELLNSKWKTAFNELRSLMTERDIVKTLLQIFIVNTLKDFKLSLIRIYRFVRKYINQLKLQHKFTVDRTVIGIF